MSVKTTKNQKKTMYEPIQINSMALFNSGIKSEKTKVNYTFSLNQFLKHYQIKPNELIEVEPKEIQKMLEQYTLFLREKGKSLGTIKTFYCALNLFLSMNDIIINWVKIRKMFPEGVKARGDKAYSTEQVRQILKLFSNNVKYTALTHFLSASAVREGFSEELKMKHLKDMPDGCKAVTVYADHVKEYTTFIHAEASKALETYFESRKQKGEKLTPDSWVFCSSKNPKKALTTNNIVTHFSHKCKDKIDRGEFKNNRYDIAITYGIRKRWKTIVMENPNVNRDIVEKMFSHKSRIPLDSAYFKPTIEVMFDEYKKTIPDLVLDESYKLKFELEKKTKKIDELEKKSSEIVSLKSRLVQIEALLQNVKPI